MLLTVDIGNTHTVLGLYQPSDGAIPSYTWRITTSVTDTVDDIRGRLLLFMGAEAIDRSTIDQAVFASVVPSLANAWQIALEKVFGIEALQCTAQLAHAQGIFKADYPRVSEIGADRVADAIGAVALYGAPVIVVDFGTATNMEVVDERGCFLGGAIAPGVETSATALFEQAKRLAAIELTHPIGPIATSTEEALRAGIVYGEAARVDGLLERIYETLGYRAFSVATGGWAPLICRHTKHISEINPDLTLAGLRIFATAILTK